MRQKSEGKEEKAGIERRMSKEDRSADRKQNKDHCPSYDKGMISVCEIGSLWVALMSRGYKKSLLQLQNNLSEKF